MNLSAYDMIIRSKVQLQDVKPFFSYLIMNLNIKVDNEIPSMGVDQLGNLYYNEEWVKNLSERNVEGVLTHEVLHIILEHLTRLGYRNRMLFNIANDLVVNDILVTEAMDLPEGLVPYNHEFTIKEYNYTITDLNKKTSEEVYEELYKFIKKNKRKGNSNIAGGFDEHYYENGKGKDGKDDKGKELTEGQINKIKKKWKDVLAEATNYAKQRGLLPAGMERLIDDLLEGKINWRSKLYKYITNELPYDYTWSKPSKKSISTGVYLPSIVKEKIEMVVSIDTSGSINQKELTEFLSEVCYIARSFNNLQMWLLVCDAKIQNEYEITNGNIGMIMNLKAGGGGGTSHRPIVDWITNNKPNTKLLISLTDGYSDIQQCFNDLNCHKLIVLSDNSCQEEQMLPYGEVIKLR